MIQTIVFDMGGVLIQFDREFFIRRLGVSAEDEALLMNEVFESLEWARMDRGSLTEAEASQSICARLPKRLHLAADRLVTMWERPILEIDGMYALIKELKANGYRILLLSNASVRQHEYWPRIPASELFDGKLISSDVHLVKPQPEIYRFLCDTFHVLPEECFFVDDSPQNVEGAYEAGIRGFIFHGDAGALRKALRAAGVAIS
jgi:putative hydrolase of the HAD superfamily